MYCDYCRRDNHAYSIAVAIGYALVWSGVVSISPTASCVADTVALWLFDEPRGTYPSSVLDSSSENDYPLVLGQGGTIVPGKFGNALATCDRDPIDYPLGSPEHGLKRPWQILSGDQGRMSWHNSRFAALMTDGDSHLRKEVGFVNAVDTDLNLADFDWTVEFWFKATHSSGSVGTVLELGILPKSVEGATTSLVLSENQDHFVLRNDPSKTNLKIETDEAVLKGTQKTWHHLAFVYSTVENQVRHYVDGKLQPLPEKCQLKHLRTSKPSYLSVGRSGSWNQPISGAIDELRISTGQVYRGTSFRTPGSFAPKSLEVELHAGPPLLFSENEPSEQVLDLGQRKHLFIDDKLLVEIKNADFVVNPPRRAERVLGNIKGPFRKHLTVVDDPDNVIRIYNSVEHDHLAVSISRDGIHFTAPEESIRSGEVARNSETHSIVIPEMVGGLGNPFIDINGPDSERWKYFSDYHRRGIYLYTSPDGYRWRRKKTATLPFRSGTQSCTFYDDQRQLYASYHRSGIHHTPVGDTERSSVVTEHKDLSEPLEFEPLSQQDYLDRQSEDRLRNPLPWYLDNGPLTPGGFGLEFSHTFRPVSDDPVGTDVYVTKAQKYPWAADTYVAFPIVYFHYWPDGPAARHALAHPERGRGSGGIETQLEVSRDGSHWQRYPRPAYVGIGKHEGRNVVNAYIAHGMVRRGDEIWQYYFGETQYHSAYRNDRAGRGVYRLVQRLDGFVSIDSPYESDAIVVTKPLTFSGNRFTLNIDTDATGYAQVGILDGKGKPIPGFSMDECVYINGDFVDAEVEWLDQGKDLSDLIGKTVQVVIRMRGSKLYAMQFVDH